jgi:hypothetical protein
MRKNVKQNGKTNRQNDR